jgi:hypothetical protein
VFLACMDILASAVSRRSHAGIEGTDGVITSWGALKGQTESVSEIDRRSAKNLYGRVQEFRMIHL